MRNPRAVWVIHRTEEKDFHSPDWAYVLFVFIFVILVVLTVLAIEARGADRPAIDPAVAAAWGFSATPAPQPMPEAMPSYRLYQDARGQWWQVPVQTPAVEVRESRPFPGPSTTPRTAVQNAAVVSTGSAGAVQYPALTYTLAPRVIRGTTNCTVG